MEKAHVAKFHPLKTIILVSIDVFLRGELNRDEPLIVLEKTKSKFNNFLFDLIFIFDTIKICFIVRNGFLGVHMIFFMFWG
jgi:hypothetical protein